MILDYMMQSLNLQFLEIQIDSIIPPNYVFDFFFFFLRGEIRFYFLSFN